MHFTDAETALLKTWIIKRLEDISDADADVLADYAIALVSTEDTEEVARANSVENLKDFLPDNAEQFVAELFETIASKSYDPSRPKVKRAPPVPQVPTGPRRDNILGPMNESRKRSFQWDSSDTFGQNGQLTAGNRPVKQLRRGGRGGSERGGRQKDGQTAPFAPQQFPHSSNIAPPTHGLPSLDPNDPAMMMAFQQFMSAMAGFSSGATPQNGFLFKPSGSRQRCRKYNETGVCAAGAACPYEHGNEGFIVPAQSVGYDPANAMLNLTPNGNGSFSLASNQTRGGAHGRGRGTNTSRGGGKRSDFSMLGPSRDSNNTSIVVEQIPDDKLDESTVHDFFSQFGSIEEVNLRPDSKLAILRFEQRQAAQHAYNSPKVIFDNRFVKVYWYNANNFEQQQNGKNQSMTGTDLDTDMADDVPEIDQEELARRQEEAQRKHEEARKQREETEKQKASIDAKLKFMEMERKKMADLLAKKSGKSPSPAHNGVSEDGDQNAALRARLAKLEAEAKELGVEPDTPLTNGYDNYSSPPYRSRGGYRGRGRGRGYYSSYRGGWGGPAARGGAVKRLDNRPKTVAVTFSNDSSYNSNDEALRQFLLFSSMDTAAIAQHPATSNTALVTFHHRYEGETFMTAAARGQIPHVGKVETSWFVGTPPQAPTNGAQDEGYEEVMIERGSSDGEDAGERDLDGDEEDRDLDRFA